MKIRFYVATGEGLAHPCTRATLGEARSLAQAVVAATGHSVRITQVKVEGPDTETVVAIVQHYNGETTPSDENPLPLKYAGVEVHEPGAQIPVAGDGPIPWSVNVTKLEAADE